MDPYFYNRIDYKGPIENILQKVCEDFKLGKYASHELIPFGYEDFNVRLNTDQGGFFVKISVLTAVKQSVNNMSISWSLRTKIKFTTHIFTVQTKGICMKFILKSRQSD